MLRVTPGVDDPYAERRVVQQNLLAALLRPLFVGIFPNAVPVDHDEHVHPLLEQTVLAVLQLVRLFTCVDIQARIHGLDVHWDWIRICIRNWVVMILVLIVLGTSLLPFLSLAQSSVRRTLQTPQIVNDPKIEVIAAAHRAAPRREVFHSRFSGRVRERSGGR